MPILQGGNVMPGMMPSVGDIIAGQGPLKLARAKYDFSVDGGAVGDIVLLTDYIPSGALIVGGGLEVTTPPTSGGGATVAIKVEGANDIINAAAISGAPWSSAGRKSVIPAFTGATWVKTTQARQITATIGTAALTAGVFEVYLFFIETV